MNRLYYTTTAIRTRLLEDEKVKAYVGENIFPCVANDNIEGDFIVLKRQAYDRPRSKMGIIGNTVVLQVAIVSDDYDRAVDIAHSVDLVMEEDVLPQRHFDDIELVGAWEDYEDFKYIQLLEYEISKAELY